MPGLNTLSDKEGFSKNKSLFLKQCPRSYSSRFNNACAPSTCTKQLAGVCEQTDIEMPALSLLTGAQTKPCGSSTKVESEGLYDCSNAVCID